MTRTAGSFSEMPALRTTSEPNPSSPRNMLPIPATRMRAVIGLTRRLHPPEPQVATGIRKRYQSQHQRDSDRQSDDRDEYPAHDFHVGLLSGICCGFCKVQGLNLV